MSLPKYTGLSHVCIIVDDINEAVGYYERVLGAIPLQCIPNWKNKGFFEAAGFIKLAEYGDVSMVFMALPGASFTIELMQYHNPTGRVEPIVFKANDVSGARHVALKVVNIEDAFDHIKEQPDVTLINQTEDYKVVTMSKTDPSEFFYYDPLKESDAAGKQVAADILGMIKSFYFVDKYGVQWEFEQGHGNVGE